MKTALKLLITSLTIFSLGFYFSFGKEVKFNGKTFSIVENSNINNLLNKRITIPNKKEEKIDGNKYDIGLSGNLNKGVNIKGKNSINFKCSGNLVYAQSGTQRKGGIKFMYLQIKDGKQKHNMQLGCKPSEKEKLSSPKESLPFNEKNVKGKHFRNYALSTKTASGVINKNDIKKRLENSSAQFQPTFTDILYLQLKTIGNINNSLKAMGTTNFSGVFKNTEGYSDYLKWNNKFNKFTNKSSFVESFSDAITLKDLGIGADIIKDLSKRLKCKFKSIKNHSESKCEKIKVTINKNYNDNFSFYSMKDLSRKIYNSNNDGIGNNFINLYESLRNIDTSKLSGKEKKMTKKFLKNMFSGSISSMKKYELGFGLNLRKRNLKILQDEYFKKIHKGKEKSNLLSIYNFFYEINNIVKGTENLSKLQERINQGNSKVEDFFSKDLPKAIIEEKKDMHSSKVLIEGENIRKTIEKNIIENYSGEYSINTVNRLEYKGSSCYDYAKENIKTKEDKWSIINGVASKGLYHIKSNGVGLIKLSTLEGTKYNKYIKNHCNTPPDKGYLVKGYEFDDEYNNGKFNWKNYFFSNILKKSDYVKKQKLNEKTEFSYNSKIPVFNKDKKEYFLLKYQGILNFPDTGKYQFRIGADYYSSLYLDNTEIAKYEFNRGSIKYGNGNIDISEKNKKKILKLNFLQEVGGSFLRLQWKKPGDSSFEAIPGCAFGEKYSCKKDLDISNGWKKFYKKGDIDLADTNNPNESRDSVKPNIDKNKIIAENNRGSCGIGGIAKNFNLKKDPTSIEIDFSEQASNYGRTNIMIKKRGDIEKIYEHKSGGNSFTNNSKTITKNIPHIGKNFKLILGNADKNSDRCDMRDHGYRIKLNDISINY